jgi:poly(glycerol-phosphate) alpha-glucosyltransferase
LYLGRIHPKKGMVNLMRAWRMANGAQRDEWVLAIAGGDQGGHEAELKCLATELGLAWQDGKAKSAKREEESACRLTLAGSQAASLLFLGPQFGADKEACYANCDAFILPSFSEGLPLVVLEAWAYGKPVLMTPECNLPEGFSARAALRIEPSPESIAQELGELFRTPHSALRAMGEEGRRLVASRFTWPRIAQEMKAVYEWILSAGPRPDCLWTG